MQDHEHGRGQVRRERGGQVDQRLHPPAEAPTTTTWSGMTGLLNTERMAAYGYPATSILPRPGPTFGHDAQLDGSPSIDTPLDRRPALPVLRSLGAGLLV